MSLKDKTIAKINCKNLNPTELLHNDFRLIERGTASDQQGNFLPY